MRLVSFIEGGVERLGVVTPGGVVAADELLPGGPSTMGKLLDRGRDELEALREASASTTVRPIERPALAAPVPRPGKIVAIGRNYREHAEEGGREVSAEPIIFAKYPTSVVGPEAIVSWRASLTAKVDYEAELAVVIGRRAREVPESDALDVVLGYTCLNDVSARDLQFGDGQYTRGKSLDTFCPMGPELVTTDEIPDPQRLGIRCIVNGEVRQSSTTAMMVFPVAELVAFASRAFTLEPGDVIATGTPAGVGHFAKPPRYLGDGDEMAVEIDGIGTLRNTCRVLAEKA